MFHPTDDPQSTTVAIMCTRYMHIPCVHDSLTTLSYMKSVQHSSANICQKLIRVQCLVHSKHACIYNVFMADDSQPSNGNNHSVT